MDDLLGYIQSRVINPSHRPAHRFKFFRTIRDLWRPLFKQKGIYLFVLIGCLLVSFQIAFQLLFSMLLGRVSYGSYNYIVSITNAVVFA
jgi:hypothetical protein